MNSYAERNQKPCSEIDVWVGEFLLHRHNPIVSAKKLLSKINVGEDAANLRKLNLLGDLREDVINGLVEERTLDQLESIEKLLSEESCRNMETLKSAYHWVAVDCTVRYMLAMDVKKGKYIDAVERIWAGRIGRLKERNSPLVTQELIIWEKDLKNALFHPDLCRRIRETNTRYNALSLLNEFVSEQFVFLEPPYLEIEVERIFEFNKRKKNLNEILGGTHNRERPNGRADDGDTGLDDDVEMSDLRNKEKRLDNEAVQEEHEQMGDEEMIVGEQSKNERIFETKRRKMNPSDISGGTLNGERPSGCDDDDEMSDMGNNEKLCHEKAAVQDEHEQMGGEECDADRLENVTLVEEFKDCLMEMMELVSNPDLGACKANDMQNALNPSNTDRDKNAQENMNDNAFETEETSSNKQENLGDNASETDETSLSNISLSKRAQRNPTQRVPQKPKRTWTAEEERALKEGVKKYGKSWKAIKNAYPDVLALRTEVNLKDKWRTIVGR